MEPRAVPGRAVRARAGPRPRRRAVAGLGVVAAVFPLAAWGGAAPALAAPLAAPAAGRVLLDGDSCDKDATTYIDQTPSALLQLGAQKANTIATGKGVVVAVVDSGVDARNAHLQGAVLPGVDLSPAQSANGQTDVFGHGTNVAGEIAARAVPGSGVIGLAPESTILPIRVYTAENKESGSGGGTTDGSPVYEATAATISSGITTAALLGAKIINVSLSTNVDDPLLAGAVRTATAKGALVVASAGNRQTSDDKSNSPRYPGALDDVLAVAAVDGSGQVTDDSIHGSYVDVAAPGVDILTTFLNAGDCQVATEYASTSYATAYVSAAAALVAQTYPNETPAQWRYRLEATALRVRPDTRDDYAGWGLIQPYEALTFVSDGNQVGPSDPAATPSAVPSASVQRVAAATAERPDTTDRDQTLWLAFGGAVGVLLLALVALLRRDRKRPVRPPRTPAGVR